MRLAIRFITLFIVSIVFVASAIAQKSETDNLQKKADKLFEEARYAEAYPMYTQLLSVRKGDPDITFKYGATLLYGSDKKAEAISYLKKASLQSSIDPRVFYFLGKAYQLNYEFDKALAAYQEFQQKGEDDQIETLRLPLSIQQCNNGKSLLSQIKDVLVLDKTDVNKEEFFRYYELENLDGKILLAPEEFQSSIDKKKGHRPIIYTTPLSNIVYFSSYGKKGDRGSDIYYATRKGDGTFSDPVLLPEPINTEYNEDYPFMHSDGRTLYFCSEGHNSMGGYDIFRSYVDDATGAFTIPENLDFAINTPDDDLLYIADSKNQNAFFASARASKQGELSVYEVKVDLVPSSIILLKGDFISELDPSLKKARISIEDDQSKRQVGVFNTDKKGGYLLDFKYGGAYNFYVEAGGSGIIHTGKVEIPRLENIAAFRQELILIDDNGVERLMIKNYFEEELGDETQELLALALKQRADLNITPQDELNQQLQRQEENASNESFENSYLAIGLNQFHSNEEVANWMDMKSMELTEGNQRFKSLSSKAYSEAKSYQEKAEEQLNEANEKFLAFEASTDGEEKADLLRSSITLRNDAKVNLLNASSAMLISNRLNSIISDREDLSATIQSQELAIRKAMLDKDEEGLTKSMATVSEFNSNLKNPKYQADPSIYLSDLKELEEMKAMQAYDSAEELRIEKNDQIELLQRLETQLAKAKDKDKPQIQARLDGVKEEIESIEEAIPEKWEEYRKLDWNKKRAERSLAFANSWDYLENEPLIPLDNEVTAYATRITNSLDNVDQMESKEEAALLSLGITYEQLMSAAAIATIQDTGDDTETEFRSEEEKIATDLTKEKETSIENELISDFDKKLNALENNPNTIDQLEGKIVLNSELLREVNRQLKDNQTNYNREELEALKADLEVETVSMISDFKKEIESKQFTTHTITDFIPEFDEQEENIESYAGSDLERNTKLSEFYGYTVDKLELILDSLNAMPFPESDAYLMRQQLEDQNALKIIITELKVKNYELKENVELLSKIATSPTEDELILSINADYQERYSEIEQSNADEDVKAAQLIQLNESLIVGLDKQLASKTEELINESDNSELIEAEIALLNQIKTDKEAEINDAVLQMASGNISADALVETNEIQDLEIDDVEKEKLIAKLMPDFKKERDAIDFSEMSLSQKRSKTLSLYSALGVLIGNEINDLKQSESDDQELKKYQALQNEVESEMVVLEEKIEETSLADANNLAANNSTEKQSEAWSGVMAYNAASMALDEYEKEGRIAKNPGFRSENLKTQSEAFYADIDAYNTLLLNYSDMEKRESSLSSKEQKKSKKQREKLMEEIQEKETLILENWIPLIQVSAESNEGGSEYLAISKDMFDASLNLRNEEKRKKLQEAYILSIMALKNGHHEKLDENRVAGLPIANKQGDGLDFNGLTITEKRVVLERNIEKIKERILEAEEQKQANAMDVTKVEQWNMIAKTYQDALVWNQNKLASLNTLNYNVKEQSDKQVSLIKAPTGQEQFSTELEQLGISKEQSEIITSDPEIQTYYAMYYVENEINEKLSTLKKMRSSYHEEGDQALENYYDGSVLSEGDASLVINDYRENAKRYQEAISWYQKTDSLDLMIVALETKQEEMERDMEAYFNTLESVNKQTITAINEGETPAIAVIEEPTDNLADNTVNRDRLEEEIIEEAIDEMDVEEMTTLEESTTPVLGDVDVSGFIFDSGQSFYSQEDPIPLDPPLPQGLIFKVQIGAFRQALPPAHFVGLSPMTAESLPNGITRYSVGIFRELNEARSAQAQVRSIGYSDAFVVAFYNGIRISLDEAKRMLNGEDASTIPSLVNASQVNNIENQGATTNTNTQGGNQVLTISEGIRAAQDVSLISSLFYTVQVGVFSKELRNGELDRISDLNLEKTSSGYFRYTSGRFEDLYDATEHKQEVIANGVNDAFVTAYSNGSRISVERAQSIARERGQTENTTEEEPVEDESTVTPLEEDESTVIDEIQNGESLPAKSDLTFVIFIGSYSTSIPNNVATALLENSDVGIKRALNGGKTIYSTKEISSYTEATIILQRFQEKGVDQAKMLYVLDGQEISQNEAFKILKQ